MSNLLVFSSLILMHCCTILPQNPSTLPPKARRALTPWPCFFKNQLVHSEFSSAGLGSEWQILFMQIRRGRAPHLREPCPGCCATCRGCARGRQALEKARGKHVSCPYRPPRTSLHSTSPSWTPFSLPRSPPVPSQSKALLGNSELKLNASFTSAKTKTLKLKLQVSPRCKSREIKCNETLIEF